MDEETSRITIKLDKSKKHASLYNSKSMIAIVVMCKCCWMHAIHLDVSCRTSEQTRWICLLGEDRLVTYANRLTGPP